MAGRKGGIASLPLPPPDPPAPHLARDPELGFISKLLINLRRDGQVWLCCSPPPNPLHGETQAALSIPAAPPLEKSMSPCHPFSPVHSLFWGPKGAFGGLWA